jgi:Arc/MetJ family transcription regulator
MRMKRTHLLVDPDLLDEARRILGARTDAATVNLALQEVIRVRRVQSLAKFFGKGLWRGSLSAMRDIRVQKRHPN